MFLAFLSVTSFLLELFFVICVMVQQEAAGCLALGCGEQQGLSGDSKGGSHSQSLSHCPSQDMGSQQHQDSPCPGISMGPMAGLAGLLPLGVNGVLGPRQGRGSPGVVAGTIRTV